MSKTNSNEIERWTNKDYTLPKLLYHLLSNGNICIITFIYFAWKNPYNREPMQTLCLQKKKQNIPLHTVCDMFAPNIIGIIKCDLKIDLIPITFFGRSSEPLLVRFSVTLHFLTKGCVILDKIKILLHLRYENSYFSVDGRIIKQPTFLYWCKGAEKYYFLAFSTL